MSKKHIPKRSLKSINESIEYCPQCGKRLVVEEVAPKRITYKCPESHYKIDKIRA